MKGQTQTLVYLDDLIIPTKGMYHANFSVELTKPWGFSHGAIWNAREMHEHDPPQNPMT